MIMKNLQLFFIAFLIFAFHISNAQVEREMVVLEIGTGTWCPYCPGAAMGADDLIANGKDVAVIEYHSGDSYQNTYSSSRLGYYGIGSFPTAKFDGTLTKVGGSSTQSLYTQYLPLYNQRKSINSSFSINIEGELYSITDYSATITVEKVASYSGSNLKLHFVLTESHIPESWQGMDELNFVARKMVPGTSGTSLDFSGGDTEIVELDFSIDDSWNYQEMEVVAFVQDNSTKEILQGSKMPLTDFLPAYDHNASVDVINNIPLENCTETVIPIAKIRNNGDAELTSLDFEYKVNEEETHTYSWTGSLDFAETELVELPEIDFTLEEENLVEVSCMNPNGNPDEYPDNDSKTSETFTGAYPTPMTVKLMLRLDKNPEETSWDVRNSSNEIIFSGDDYTQPNQNIFETFEFDEQDCYTFNIYDEGEDGLNTPGFYMLLYGNNVVIIENTDFGGEESIQFGAGGFVGQEELVTMEGFEFYPNPVKENGIVEFSLAKTSTVDLEILDITGKTVFADLNKNYNAGNHRIIKDFSLLEKGLYIIRVKTNYQSFTKKISLIK